MDEGIGSYKRARRKFSYTVYLITLVWLLLGLLQWMIVNQLEMVGKVFLEYEWISAIFFALGIILALTFIFFEKSRFIKCLNWFLTILIVEFVIIGLFALVAKVMWSDLLLWYGICVCLLFIFVLAGVLIPHDMTLDVVILFVISFVFLIVSVFLMMFHLLSFNPYTYILYQIFITIIILIFVMYHAQTINGGRFAEMRVNDHLLATIILFYDFIVIFLLTFYVQMNFNISTRALAEDSMWRKMSSTSSSNTTVALQTVDTNG